MSQLSSRPRPQTWQRVLDINFYACQSFGRRALERGRGSAVPVSSMSAQIVCVPQFQASYHARKAGVSLLVRAPGGEWAPRGVRVNAIAPGYMLSEMTRQFTDANPDLARQWTDAIPIGRMGRPENLSGLVASWLRRLGLPHVADHRHRRRLYGGLAARRVRSNGAAGGSVTGLPRPRSAARGAAVRA